MKKIFILFLVSSTLFSQAQTSYGDYKDAANLCIALQGNSFSSDEAADNALDRILSVIGASKRFILQPCSEISNAVAISYKGIRYILYDREFMNELNSNSNSWSSLSILAHEVGHHINGHSVDIILYATDATESKSLAEKRQQELEADEFSGFIMAKLGASLNQASEAIANLSSNSDDSYSTHPSRDKRLNAIRNGYSRANSNSIPIAYETPTTLAADDYFYRAYVKQSKGDFSGAVSDYTKLLEIEPNNYEAAYNRGLSNLQLGSHFEAIFDFNKYIENNPPISKVAEAYYVRGYSKIQIEDNYGAISDFNRIANYNIKEGEKEMEAISISMQNDLQSKYNEVQDAIEYYQENDNSWTNKIKAEKQSELIAMQESLQNLQNEITEKFTRIAEEVEKACFENLNSEFKALIFIQRGIAKGNIGDLSGACTDWREAADLGDEDAAQFVKDQCN